jgi:hypothetical protein
MYASHHITSHHITSHHICREFDVVVLCDWPTTRLDRKQNKEIMPVRVLVSTELQSGHRTLIISILLPRILMKKLTFNWPVLMIYNGPTCTPSSLCFALWRPIGQLLQPLSDTVPLAFIMLLLGPCSVALCKHVVHFYI